MDHISTIAQWVAFYESSGLTQEEFARVHAVPARTLRSWKQKLRGRRQPPAEAVREVVEKAIAALAAVRDRLDAACREVEQPSPVEARTYDLATPSSEQPGAEGGSPVGLLHQVLPGAVADTGHHDEPGPLPATPPDASTAPAALGKVHRRGFFSDLL